MVNVNAFIAALKATWLRKIIIDNNSLWSIKRYENVLDLGTHFIMEKYYLK